MTEWYDKHDKKTLAAMYEIVTLQNSKLDVVISEFEGEVSRLSQRVSELETEIWAMGEYQ